MHRRRAKAAAVFKPFAKPIPAQLLGLQAMRLWSVDRQTQVEIIC